MIVFADMFPPLCNRIKLQLCDNDVTTDEVIATHFLELSQIMDPGSDGEGECACACCLLACSGERDIISSYHAFVTYCVNRQSEKKSSVNYTFCTKHTRRNLAEFRPELGELLRGATKLQDD